VTPAVFRIFFRFGARLDQQRKQQPLGGDIAVAGLFRELLGLIEDARRLGREIKLARRRPFDLGKLLQGRLDAGQREFGLAARGANEPGGETFLVVEQNFQNMFGGEALMARSNSKPLSRLDEASAAIGIFLQIHVSSFQARLARPRILG